MTRLEAQLCRNGLAINWTPCRKPLPPCTSCGTPTANLKSLICQPCKEQPK